MNNLSNKQRQEIVDTKLLNFDQLKDYAKKAFETMGGFDIRFPVLAVIERIEKDDLPIGLGFRQFVRQAEWKQCICKSSVYVDQQLVIHIGDSCIGERT